MTGIIDFHCNSVRTLGFIQTVHLKYCSPPPKYVWHSLCLGITTISSLKAFSVLHKNLRSSRSTRACTCTSTACGCQCVSCTNRRRKYAQPTTLHSTQTGGCLSFGQTNAFDLGTWTVAHWYCIATCTNSDATSSVLKLHCTCTCMCITGTCTCTCMCSGQCLYKHVIAKCLSARHLIWQHCRSAFVYMYVYTCMSVTLFCTYACRILCVLLRTHLHCRVSHGWANIAI